MPKPASHAAAAAKAQLPIEHSRNTIYSANDSAELETHTFSHQWKSSGAGDAGARRTDADDASDGGARRRGREPKLESEAERFDLSPEERNN